MAIGRIASAAKATTTWARRQDRSLDTLARHRTRAFGPSGVGRRWAATGFVLAFFALALLAPRALALVVSHKVAFAIESDPRALRDPFAALSEHELASRFSDDEAKPLVELVADTRRFDDHVFVNVVLVGLDAESAPQLAVDPADLNAFLAALVAAEPSVPLNARDGSAARGRGASTGATSTVDAAVWVKHRFTASAAPRALGEAVNRALVRELRVDGSNATAPRAATPLEKEMGVSVPFEAVTELLRAHYMSTPMLDGTYTLFVVHARAPVADAPYWYYPHEVLDGDAAPTTAGAADARSRATACGGVLWADPAARFAWVDLGAGPAEYGPALEGDGPILWSSIPRPQAGADPAELMSALVSFVWRTTRALFSPPMWAPSDDAPMLSIRLVIVDARTETERAAPTPDGESAANEARLNELGNALMMRLTPLLLPGQALDVSQVRLAVEDWPLVAAALASARRTRLVLDDGEPPHEGDATTVLDSAELAAALTPLARVLHRSDGTPFLPVFVLNVGAQQLLFDGETRVLALDDLVLVLESTAIERPPFTCMARERGVLLPPDSLERELVAALLQTAWGVAPTQLATRGHASRRLTTDWLWTTSNCPFGPFAAGTTGATISFAPRDAIARGAVHGHVNRTLVELGSLLGHLERFGVEVTDVLTAADATALAQRWNVLKHKLDQTSLHLSVAHFPEALYYARSLAHDVAWLHTAIHGIGRQLHSHVVCPHDQPSALERLGLLPWLMVVWLLALADLVRKRRARDALLRRQDRPQAMGR